MKEKRNSAIGLKYLGYDFIKFTAIPGLLFYRPKKIFLSNEAKKAMKGGCILMSNHMGMVDPLILMVGLWKRRHHFIATKELFDSPFRNFLFTYCFLCIKIDRDSSMLSTMNKAVDHLKMGDMVTIFPEGHVNMDDDGIKAFKGGIVLMARRASVPIIPVYIKKRKNILERQLYVIGKPIYVSELLKTMSSKEIPEYIHSKEEELRKIAFGESA